MTKKPNIKKCKICGTEFEKKTIAHVVCCYNPCGVLFMASQNDKRIKKEWGKEKKELKEKIKTHSDYKKELQTLVNKIARIIDYGQPCIATGKLEGKRNGGHFIAVGSNDTIRFNLHNIHIQSEYSNTYKGGDNFKYCEGIERIYGIDYLERIKSLKSTLPIKLSIDELKLKIRLAKEIIKDIDIDYVWSNPKDRIEQREKFNNVLGIYSSLY